MKYPAALRTICASADCAQRVRDILYGCPTRRPVRGGSPKKDEPPGPWTSERRWKLWQYKLREQFVRKGKFKWSEIVELAKEYVAEHGAQGEFGLDADYALMDRFMHAFLYRRAKALGRLPSAIRSSPGYIARGVGVRGMRLAMTSPRRKRKKRKSA